MSVVEVEKQRNMAKSRQAWRLFLALVCTGGFIWSGWAWWTARRHGVAMAEIESEMATGRFGVAAAKLHAVLAEQPGSDEAAFLLGICERERRRDPAAAEAWARVAPGSAFAHQAILARMRLFHDNGRLAAAEQLINDAAEDPRNDRSDLRVLLVPIFSQLGRVDEAARLIESRWEHLNETGEGASERAAELVRMHVELTLKASPVGDVRDYLEKAAALAPDDDRVWLGQANLAIRTGAHDAAKRWLDFCLLRRSEDVPVWRARLSWGMAANRIDVVEQALRHLPAATTSPAGLLRLKAWISAHRGDVESERRDLQRLLAMDPAEPTALDGLAQIVAKRGQPAQTAELSRRKAERDGLRARYEKLFDRKQPVRDAVEMARLAERLGRKFEARGWLTLASSEDPEREELQRDLRRMNQSSATVVEHGRTLAEVLAQEPGNGGKIDVTPSR